MTNGNYTAEWQLLDKIISCHINNLIKLDPIIQPSVKEMRKLYNTIESNV